MPTATENPRKARSVIRSIPQFLAKTIAAWWVLIVALLFALLETLARLLGLGEVRDWIVEHRSLWLWLAAGAVLLATFVAFHRVRVERDNTRQERDEARSEGDAGQQAASQQIAGILVQDSTDVTISENTTTLRLAPATPGQLPPGSVFLPDLVKGVRPPIIHQLFKDQDIYGPAVILPLGEKFVVGENKIAGRWEDFWLDCQPSGKEILGVIGLYGGFLRCRLFGISLLVPPETRRKLIASQSERNQ